MRQELVKVNAENRRLKEHMEHMEKKIERASPGGVSVEQVTANIVY